MSPKVSIVVPCYNHERFVGKLIESIYSQTFKDFELTVLDDGSKDNSPQILKALAEKYKFKLIIKENEGICKTLNRGIELSRGEFFIAIASDDFIPTNRLQEQVSFLETHPSVDVVAGSLIVVDNDGNELGPKKPKIQGPISFDQMLEINRVLAATVMMRRSVFQRFGSYGEGHVFEDYHMWLKILKNGGSIANTNNMWAYYRVSNPDLEKKFNWYYKGMVQALNDYKDIKIAQKSILKQRMIYSIKLTLLIGKEFFTRYAEVIHELNVTQRLFLRCISFVPKFIRHFSLKVLKLKT